MSASSSRSAANRLASAACILGVLGATPAVAQDTTVWDGVYTETQARRGQEHYRELCSYCHRADLIGGGSEAGAPALKGSIFTTPWENGPLVDLFVTIGTTMPQQEPDSLQPQVVIDIVSFLLEANDVPPGDAELSPDLEALEQILFTPDPVN